jgi:hypothetical protein
MGLKLQLFVSTENDSPVLKISQPVRDEDSITLILFVSMQDTKSARGGALFELDKVSEP